jgi:hypothetical protein
MVFCVFIRKLGPLPQLAILTLTLVAALAIFAYETGRFRVLGTSDARIDCIITATEDRTFRGQIVLQLSHNIFVLLPNDDIEAIPQSDVKQVTILHKAQVH